MWEEACYEKKGKTIFKCNNCGYESIRWMGKCPECNTWSSMEEEIIISEKKSGKSSQAPGKSPDPIKLSAIDIDESQRIKTSIEEFNRVLGGGIVRDSVTILTARPGAGKSTLLLEIANDIAKKNYRVLYASGGEESETQIRSRANRIIDNIPEDIWILSDTSMDNVLRTIEKVDPDLIIVDSIQTFTLAEFDSRLVLPYRPLKLPML